MSSRNISKNKFSPMAICKQNISIYRHIIFLINTMSSPFTPSAPSLSDHCLPLSIAKKGENTNIVTINVASPYIIYSTKLKYTKSTKRSLLPHPPTKIFPISTRKGDPNALNSTSKLIISPSLITPNGKVRALFPLISESLKPENRPSGSSFSVKSVTTFSKETSSSSKAEIYLGQDRD